MSHALETATHLAPPSTALAPSASSDALDTPPLPVPPLPVRRPREWRRAACAMQVMAEDPERTDQVFELSVALDGGDSERVFRALLAEPGGAELLMDAPDLPGLLLDQGALEALPAGSVGRAYLALMTRNGFDPDGLSKLAEGVPEFGEISPGRARQWWSTRQGVVHDLMHVVTGYSQESCGELALTAFTAGVHGRARRMFIHRFALVGSVLFDPQRPRLRQVGMLRRAWKRGARARVPFSYRWEQALARPLEDVRRELELAPFADVHGGDDL